MMEARLVSKAMPRPQPLVAWTMIEAVSKEEQQMPAAGSLPQQVALKGTLQQLRAHAITPQERHPRLLRVNPLPLPMSQRQVVPLCRCRN